MPRFFIDRKSIENNRVIIFGDDAKHISRVLRMKEGEHLTLCDGMGCDYNAKISRFNKNEVTCEILSQEENSTEPGINITLFQALPKSGKMEYIIQKCTELGINKIIPCIMERCVVKLNSEADIKKKTERYQSIALAAAKQSGRGIVPDVLPPISFDAALELLGSYELAFVPYENESSVTLKDVLSPKNSVKSIAFIIGPEGGISDAELEKIKSHDIPTVTLGKRILRTETASTAVLSMINYEFLL